MDATAPHIFVALETSGLGQAIRQSVWVYPAANIGHVVSVVAFFAAVAVLDLALLGVLDGGPVLANRARRAAMALFAGVALSGFVLFTAEASHLVLNRVFLIKLAIIGLALGNALLLGRPAIAALVTTVTPATTGRLATTGNRISGLARLTGAVSLALWLVVIALGRLIAYL